MSDTPTATRPINAWALPALAALLLTAAALVALRLMGRVWWCACAGLSPWTSDIWSRHCSQHLFDPYTLSHISHGLLFFIGMEMLARLLPPPAAARFTMPLRFILAVALEAGWELLENTPMVIERYRSVTISLDYNGDSVLNSLGDILACATGFLIAMRLGVRPALMLFAALEIITLFWIRDNLTLNIVMLLYPIDTIRQWQTPATLR
ncbi:MAG: DUF2585 family protein [Phycisphaerales bacterium]